MRLLVTACFLALLVLGCTTNGKPHDKTTPVEQPAGLTQDRIEALVQEIQPGMSPDEVTSLMGTKPSMINSDVWTYFGQHSGNSDMESDLAIRFKDGVVTKAWISWTCIYRTLKE